MALRQVQSIEFYDMTRGDLIEPWNGLESVFFPFSLNAIEIPQLMEAWTYIVSEKYGKVVWVEDLLQ